MCQSIINGLKLLGWEGASSHLHYILHPDFSAIFRLYIRIYSHFYTHFHAILVTPYLMMSSLHVVVKTLIKVLHFIHFRKGLYIFFTEFWEALVRQLLSRARGSSCSSSSYSCTCTCATA